ncbi:MAG: Uma2 family endonuclease [Pirellulaceae bacterium]
MVRRPRKLSSHPEKNVSDEYLWLRPDAMSTNLRLTLDEYDHMVNCGAFDAVDSRVELIRGELCGMNPAGPLHDDLIGYLHDWSVRSTLRATIHIHGQTGMSIPQADSRPEPDVFWVKAKRYLTAHPTGGDTLLAIEVSESSLRSDRTTKADLYAEAGVQEYWVVDVGGKCIYVMREATDGHYVWQRTARIGEELSPLAEPTAVLNIADLFGECST